MQADRVHGERRGQPVPQRCREGEGLIEVGPRQQYGELVAAEAGEQVAATQGRSQALPDHGQQLVSGVVAQAVVDLLEPVEIEQQQGQRIAPGGSG